MLRLCNASELQDYPLNWETPPGIGVTNKVSSPISTSHRLDRVPERNLADITDRAIIDKTVTHIRHSRAPLLQAQKLVSFTNADEQNYGTPYPGIDERGS